MTTTLAPQERDRAKIADTYKWNLADIFPSLEAWRSFWSEARSPAIRCRSVREPDTPAGREGAARGPCGDPVITDPERWRGLVTDVTIALCPGPT